MANGPSPTLVLLRSFNEGDRTFLVTELSPFYNIVEPAAFDEATLTACLTDADAAIGSAVTATMLESAPRLRLLQCPGAGVDRIDLALLARYGVQLGASHTSAPHVAEHGVAMVLALLKRLVIHDARMRGANHEDWQSGNDEPDGLMGKTVGYLGFGAIGKALHARLRGFGITALATSRRRTSGREDGVAFVTFEALTALADILIVCAPFTRATERLLDAAATARMPAGSYLVNLSRAEIVDPDALVGALDGGRLGGAAFDVWPGNSDGYGSDLLARLGRFENVVLSPHRAGRNKSMAPHLPGIRDNLIQFARTGSPEHQVDLQLGY